MTKLLKKLALVMLPVVIYFAIFIYFEPYNYFGLKHNEYVSDSAIVRVRNFLRDPADVIILGDSRMAHFDIDLVESIVGEDVGQLAFGGASINESMDLLEYALKTNPDIHTVYFGASFYTLNRNYYKDRMSQIETIATNPLAYMLNFNYNMEMLNEIRYFIRGEENVHKRDEGVWTEKDYFHEDGTPRKYRKNLQEFADKLYNVCYGYEYDRADVDRYIELAKMCRDRGITLYTVLPPLDDSMIDIVVHPLGLEQYIEKFISQVEDYTTILNFEYNETNIFTQDEFYDGLHLDVVRGMPRYTQMLFDR
ncbi:MAG: hypothetical protein IKK99_00430 [Oscillospiraceae bacterium]|nr:hypothetical protein [Oscillospiraceae bacterium]